MVKVKEDVSGWKMWEHGVPDSRLTVLRQAEDYIQPNGKHVDMWLCECNCKEHNQIIVDSRRLKTGRTKSCGCLQKEIASKMMSKVNEYELNLEDEHGLYGIGYCYNTGKEFYFDMDDYEKIKNYCWSEGKRKRDDYSNVRAYDKITKKSTCMHHIVFGRYADHIDRNPLNNRRHNLRAANPIENARNKSLKKCNKYGVTGICWLESRSKWQAFIGMERKNKHLGYFKNKEDAIKARLEAEAKYFGEFAPQRHLFERYGIKV